ncbi:hypothetical protein KCP69_04045 [Salmonella enterica subsp. enterica]|nr:hypothetical protein KCP69_04045 [Salmonella enterica subsp. enterica]
MVVRPCRLRHAGGYAGVSVPRAYLSGAERQKFSAIAGQTGDLPPDKAGYSFNDYINFSDSAARENGGEKRIFVPILATTTVRDLTI